LSAIDARVAALERRFAHSSVPTPVITPVDVVSETRIVPVIATQPDRPLQCFGGEAPTFVREFPSIFKELEGRTWSLLYRGTRDGFGSRDFHEKCDSRYPTVTILQTRENGPFSSRVFGGYTRQMWDSVSGYKKELGTIDGFLFNLRGTHSGKPKRYRLSDKEKAIYCNAGYGPTFGSGHDLHVCDQCQTVNNSYTNCSASYTATDTSQPDEDHFLNGTRTFYVDEIEVFQIIAL
jgi:hypothetical protein